LSTTNGQTDEAIDDTALLDKLPPNDWISQDVWELTLKLQAQLQLAFVEFPGLVRGQIVCVRNQ
jgi:hypothetical protein